MYTTNLRKISDLKLYSTTRVYKKPHSHCHEDTKAQRFTKNTRLFFVLLCVLVP